MTSERQRKILDGMMADGLTLNPDATHTTQAHMIVQESIPWIVIYEELEDDI